MKILSALILFFSVLLKPAFAEVTEYDFELIIFEDTSGRYANSEQWQHELPDSIADTSEIEITPQGTQTNNTDPNAVANISQIKGIGLNKYAKKLRANKRYNVLVHKAWRQTGLADDVAVDIPIDSRPAVPKHDAKTLQTGDVNNIHGSIKMVLGRYLHIYTDMIYQQPRKEPAPVLYDQGLQQYQEYPIKFHRRMRSKELHYLDHPMVGILVMAKPVKIKEKPKEEA